MEVRNAIIEWVEMTLLTDLLYIMVHNTRLAEKWLGKALAHAPVTVFIQISMNVSLNMIGFVLEMMDFVF